VVHRERPRRQARHEAGRQRRKHPDHDRLRPADPPGREISRTGLGQASARATSAVVAANDIWKPGAAAASGCSARMINAATARVRRLIAWRSNRMAAKATEAVIAARSAGGGAPDTTR
jgi:hypothetical protein